MDNIRQVFQLVYDIFNTDFYFDGYRFNFWDFSVISVVISGLIYVIFRSFLDND